MARPVGGGRGGRRGRTSAAGSRSRSTPRRPATTTTRSGSSAGRDGGYRLAVHIADVAHYVREGGALDQEAYLRGTSVYFPDRVVPMLPHALSSDVCSLVEGQDRLTQSVVIDLDARGRVEKTAFHDGVIRSAARLSYQQAQAIVDGDAEARERFAPLVPSLAGDGRAREAHARAPLRARLARLRPAGAEARPRRAGRDDRHRAPRAPRQHEARRGVHAGRERGGGGGAAPRRRGRPLPRSTSSPTPGGSRSSWTSWPRSATACRGSSTTVRPEHFQLILRQIEGKPEEKLVSYLLLRTMKLARYHEENLGHFGLATEMYAHFTSPIRRYPDLVVHRALRALRQGKDAEREAWLREKLPEMGLHLSERERRASEAERELIEWKKVRFMAGRLGEKFQGYVTGVQAFGLFVELDEVYVQGLVHVSSMNDDYYRFDEKAHLLKGENTKKTYRLGDRVEVQVARVDLDRRQIDFALVDVLARARGSRRPGARPRCAPRGRRGAAAADARPGARRRDGRGARARRAPKAAREPC